MAEFIKESNERMKEKEETIKKLKKKIVSSYLKDKIQNGNMD